MAIPEGDLNYNIMDIKQALESTTPYHRYNPEKPAQIHSVVHFSHVKNLNDASTDLIVQAEAEAATIVHVPTVRRPLSVRKFTSLIPTLLG